MGLYTLVKGRKRRWEVIFPFGSILHTHFHHCRQCREKNPLHDAPEKSIQDIFFTIHYEKQYMKKRGDCIQQHRTQKKMKRNISDVDIPGITDP